MGIELRDDELALAAVGISRKVAAGRPLQNFPNAILSGPLSDGRSVSRRWEHRVVAMARRLNTNNTTVMSFTEVCRCLGADGQQYNER